MAHDFSSVTGLTSKAASHASNAKSAVGSHSDPDLHKAVNELGDAVNTLADAINALADTLNR